MAMKVAIEGVRKIDEGVWAFAAPPHQIRQFGEPKSSVGEVSVLHLNGCDHDAETNTLAFNFDAALPLNIGTSSRALAVMGAAGGSGDGDKFKAAEDDANALFGPGDLQFLDLAKHELSAAMAQTAQKLLAAVRGRSAGDLKRGKSRNFSETPDNFWYVIVQPRIDELSITIRGHVSKFRDSAGLEVKDDRGNTRFKVRGEADLPAAVELIFQAIRRA